MIHYSQTNNGRAGRIPVAPEKVPASEVLFAATSMRWNGVLEGEGKSLGVWYSDLKYGV